MVSQSPKCFCVASLKLVAFGFLLPCVSLSSTSLRAWCVCAHIPGNIPTGYGILIPSNAKFPKFRPKLALFSHRRTSGKALFTRIDERPAKPRSLKE